MFIMSSNKFDLIKTISDDDEVPDLSEQSDEEEEVICFCVMLNHIFYTKLCKILSNEVMISYSFL